MADNEEQLVSQVPITIDNRFKNAILTANIKLSRATATPGGAAGNIGVSQGNLKITGTYEIVILKTQGPQISSDDLAARSHTLEYPVGPRRYILTGFTISDEDLKIDNDGGNTRMTGSFVALRRIRSR